MPGDSCYRAYKPLGKLLPVTLRRTWELFCWPRANAPHAALVLPQLPSLPMLLLFLSSHSQTYVHLCSCVFIFCCSLTSGLCSRLLHLTYVFVVFISLPPGSRIPPSFLVSPPSFSLFSTCLVFLSRTSWLFISLPWPGETKTPIKGVCAGCQDRRQDRQVCAGVAFIEGT